MRERFESKGDTRHLAIKAEFEDVRFEPGGLTIVSGKPDDDMVAEEFAKEDPASEFLKNHISNQSK